MSSRKTKKAILQYLAGDHLAEGIVRIGLLPSRQAVGPLFSLFYSGDEKIRWGAIAAMGEVVCKLAEKEMEAARVVMRRMMWNLNDESGGIGWGSPEAMGEVMARTERICREFAPILVSYIDPAGNYLEHETLQRGALWGVGRLALERPAAVMTAAPLLLPFLDSSDPYHRGFASWALGNIGGGQMKEPLTRLVEDEGKLRIFLEYRLTDTTVGQMARKALTVP